jgi:apolipoprotein N-acyltransferase
LGVSLFAGLVASLALPPIGVLIGLFAFSLPIAAAIHSLRNGGSIRYAALIGWMTGTGWLLFSLSWISNSLITSGGGHIALIPISLIGIPAFLGLFWAAAFAAAYLTAKRLHLNPTGHLIFIIIFMSVFDYSRGFILTGFPWNSVGLVMASHDWGLQMASVFGYWGAGLLVLLFGALPAMVLTGGRKLAGITLVSIMVMIAMTQISGTGDTSSRTGGLVARIVQPNIPQNDKWDSQKRQQHLAHLVALSRRPGNVDIDVIVWPETAFAGIFEHEQGVISAIAQAATQGSVPVVTGLMTVDENPFRIYNSAMMFTPDGQAGPPVSKRHLVPFGEYIPLRSFVPFIDTIVGFGDFSLGTGSQVITFDQDSGIEGGLKALTLICYEVIFPAAVRRAAIDEEADIIISMSNDAWFGNTIGPLQHLAMAQMRSAELGIPMIRSTNTGVSALIDSRGHIIKVIEYGQAGFIDGDIGPKSMTIYRQYGDLIYVVMILLLGAFSVGQRLTKTKR